ncbi:MAG: VUT family protein [Bacteroidia bacterium]|nr:MAG: VUT family protein [Bacteroidia bacterium]
MFNPPEIIPDKIRRRREAVFILLSGFFLGTLAILNILGISRQIDLSFFLFGVMIPLVVFVGVLPYPITFLCTDFISELYGKRRAKMVVWTGLVLNIWVLLILWIGGLLPPHPAIGPDNLPLHGDPQRTFFQIRQWTFGATIASMIAYLTAQFIDVHIFHYFKKLTKGKSLWLRNNGSTLTSQMVDSIAVVSITWIFAKSAIHIQPGETAVHAVIILISSNYLFKMVSALVDTIPFYMGTRFLSKYLEIDTALEFKTESSPEPI